MEACENLIDKISNDESKNNILQALEVIPRKPVELMNENLIHLQPLISLNIVEHKPNNINVTDSKEDNEDLISKLSVYEQLEDGEYSCKLCSQIFDHDKKHILLRHILKDHTFCNEFECSHCLSSFQTGDDLVKHWHSVHMALKFDEDKEKPKIKCIKCEFVSNDDKLLNMHILRKHVIMYKYVCSCCAKCFMTYNAKYKHEVLLRRQKNQEGPRYGCSKCPKLFKSKEKLSEHLMGVHNYFLSQNGFKTMQACKRCEKVFLTKKIVAEHSEVHEEGYPCKECGKRLSSKEHLKKHALVHSGERPYMCSVCYKSFALRTTMRVHALSHSGIKPYSCKICNHNYSQRSALMMHWNKKHKYERPPSPIEIHQYFDEYDNLLV